MIEKTYDAASIEPRIAERWEAADAFRAGAGARAGADPFSIVIPPPNVTGSLHIGHALNNTLQDVLVRFERMRGKNVLWQPGMDHAGIATQMVVERQLRERKEPGRRDMGREAFVERIWRWKEESGGTIIGQLRRLGASCDWSRERFTMDEGLSRAVREVFVDLYSKGLIFKDKRLVNWDPKLLTAISDLEVEPQETKGHLWHFRYPLADGASYEHPYTLDGEGNRTAWKPSDGEPVGYETRDYLVVATTRPETMLGDTGIAVHPDDPRYKGLVGRHVVLPLVGRRIPVIADAYPDPEAGTGAVKMTPAHDFNDFEVGRRHGLPQINVMTPEAAITLRTNADFLAGLALTDELQQTIDAVDRLDRFAAREKIVAMMEAGGFLAGVEDHTHMVPHGDRGGVPIEPFLTDQWYVDAGTLAGPAIASVREGRTEFVPKSWEKTYFEWMENIQPWCISRQLWWGHQIPAWYGPAILDTPSGTRVGSGSGPLTIFVDKTVDGAVIQAENYYANIPVVVVANEREAKAHRALNDPAVEVAIWRDEDVLDTWFSSALWPFSTLGWPEETPELATYYPTSALVTGFDIIFFWVARMMMMGLRCTGQEPFRTVYVHALVRDKNGAKMSKSKGNVIDPIELFDEFGADAVRFTLAIMAAQGRDVKLDPQRIAGYRNFGTKLWNATRFAGMNGARHGADVDPRALTLQLNRWLLTELARTIRETETAIEAYRFNEAAGALYRFVWNAFCDWYVELSKPIFLGEDEAAKEETRRVTGYALDRVFALLHPFMPFLTEELWTLTAPQDAPRAGLLCHAAWPTVAFEDGEAADDINWLIALVGEIRSVRTEMNVPPGAEAAFVAVEPDAALAARLDRHDASLRRLARLATIGRAGEAPRQSAQFVVAGGSFALPLEGMIDIEAERRRLTKARDKAEDEAARIDKKLDNEKFVANAPEEVVEQEREKREAYRAEAEKLALALSRLDS